MTYTPEFPRLRPSDGADMTHLVECYTQDDGCTNGEYIREFAPHRYTGMVRMWHEQAMNMRADFGPLRELAKIADEVSRERKAK